MGIPEMQPAVIITNQRTGGTFLAWCLSNHASIHCERGEILHSKNRWSGAYDGDAIRLLDAALHCQFYRISMVKLVYSQAFRKEIREYLVELQPLVIWLVRENLLRQAVSVFLLKMSNKGQVEDRVHTVEDSLSISVRLDPGAVLSYMGGLDRRNKRARDVLKDFEHVLRVTYREITGGENEGSDRLPEAVGTQICEFLQIPYRPMRAELKRVNPYPLNELISNWTELKMAVRKSRFSRFVESDAEDWG